MLENELLGKNFQHEVDSARRDASIGTSLDSGSHRHQSPPTVETKIKKIHWKLKEIQQFGVLGATVIHWYLVVQHHRLMNSLASLENNSEVLRSF